jgi:hypothetical protein
MAILGEAAGQFQLEVWNVNEGLLGKFLNFRGSVARACPQLGI